MAPKERDPRMPYNMPKELESVWRKHREKADAYMAEHESWGYGEKYYNLSKKHEAVCEYLERSGEYASMRAQLMALRERVSRLPSDYGSAGEMVEAVRRLKSDLSSGSV